ncbi:hypothetical protein BY996DRAFT_6494201, partial [Phakopsora pachyrhizi]
SLLMGGENHEVFVRQASALSLSLAVLSWLYPLNWVKRRESSLGERKRGLVKAVEEVVEVELNFIWGGEYFVEERLGNLTILCLLDGGGTANQEMVVVGE